MSHPVYVVPVEQWLGLWPPDGRPGSVWFCQHGPVGGCVAVSQHGELVVVHASHDFVPPEGWPEPVLPDVASLRDWVALLAVDETLAKQVLLAPAEITDGDTSYTALRPLAEFDVMPAESVIVGPHVWM